MNGTTIVIATRGSVLALAQANLIREKCIALFPEFSFALKVIRTVGDRLENGTVGQSSVGLPKGLFTKELEVALLNCDADLAVHSLKDLPTELPSGLKLGAVTERADVRDVLIIAAPNGSQQIGVETLRRGAVIGTSSTRRGAQLLAVRPDLKIVELRGNIITRLLKLSRTSGFDAIVLAAAGLERIGVCISSNGVLIGNSIPQGLCARALEFDVMVPCVGQGALGIEIREGDERIANICNRLNHTATEQCTGAERSFLAAMGGGCASPVAALAEIVDTEIRMHALSFPDGVIHRAFGISSRNDFYGLGRQLARILKQNAPSANCMAACVGAR